MKDLKKIKEIKQIKELAAITVLGLAFSASLVAPVHAAGCSHTCVEVHREGGELVITAHRDPVRPVAPTTPAPPSVSPTPSPSATSTIRPRRPVSKIPKKPIKRAPRPSLSNQIRELLPEGSFIVRPARGALVHEPLLIATSGCAPISKKLPILDTSVELNLQPTVFWKWGDGTSQWWSSGVQTRGAHIFDKSGRYLIEMECHWGGFFRTPNSPWLPIPQGILATSRQVIEIYRATLFFTE